MKRLRVVLDANILFSSIFWFGKPRLLRKLARQGKFIAISSEFILDEVRKALIEDLQFTPDQAERKVNNLRRISNIVRPTEKINAIIDDPSDNRILECARRGKASFIVTGDHHLLNLEKYKGIKIVTAAEFFETLDKEAII